MCYRCALAPCMTIIIPAVIPSPPVASDTTEAFAAPHPAFARRVVACRLAWPCAVKQSCNLLVTRTFF